MNYRQGSNWTGRTHRTLNEAFPQSAEYGAAISYHQVGQSMRGMAVRAVLICVLFAGLVYGAVEVFA